MGKKKNGADVTLPHLFYFTSVKTLPATRNNNCDSLICKIGQMKGFEKHPRNDQEKWQTSQTKRRCSDYCHSIVGRAISYSCNTFTFPESCETTSHEGLLSL